VRALLSVYDKSDLEVLARGLVELGWELVASGNTSAALTEAGVPHLQVAAVTGAPEMLGGRVKTLHPTIHGGILADRAQERHMADLAEQGIEPFDLVVCNLYPFRSDPSVELIDIGGPAMVRAAAKNHAHVGVVVDPSEYPGLLEELRESGALSDHTRRRLARAAFAHTAAYDAAIVDWFDQGGAGGEPELLPATLHLALEREEELRYGENPHQRGARYRATGKPGWWDGVVQRAGSALSYLNVFDADAAWRLVHDLRASGRGDGAGRGTPGVAVAIIKHANPCGAAVAAELARAYALALEGDPVSAFGGVVALGGTCTAAVARQVAGGPQADVIVASAFDAEAVDILVERRKATRLLEAPPYDRDRLELRSLGGGYLVQDGDRFESVPSSWRVVTKAAPPAEKWPDLELAWKVCARTSSNAIVVASGGQALGIGAGQQSRVEAAEIAVRKAGGRAAGAVAASDAFFPFRDGLDVLAAAGVSVVVQPGGSVRDADLIEAADEHGVAMVLTGERHFRH
jgi:phosphoribosylaminoimidazolecarboxamide formyltransferase / IMP cyclohydrolase